MRLPREVLSYADIKARGDSFLRAHHRDKTFPVDIERIVEFDLQVEIVPTPYLCEKCGVDAFIVPDCSAVYIDLEQFIPITNRGRFSLAHEAAHAILHRKAMSLLKGNWHQRDYQTYFHIQEAINTEDLGWIEYQAFAMAGVLLVPPDELVERVRVHRAAYAESGFPQELIRELIRSDVAEYFHVSTQVIERRCEYEKIQL